MRLSEPSFGLLSERDLDMSTLDYDHRIKSLIILIVKLASIIEESFEESNTDSLAEQ